MCGWDIANATVAAASRRKRYSDPGFRNALAANWLLTAAGSVCQTADWKIRHKILCKKAKAEKDMTLRTSALLEAFARQRE